MSEGGRGHGRRARRGAARASVLVALACLGAGSCGGSAPAPTWTAAADGRFRALLADSATAGYYGVDLADVTPVLGQVLLTGFHDPLKRAKVELAQMGAPGVAVAEDIINRYWTEPQGVNYVMNALGVARLSDTEGGLRLLRRALEHPSERVRVEALRGLEGRGTAQDFDAVLAQVDLLSNGEFRAEALVLLHQLDPERAAEVYLQLLNRADVDPQLAANLLPLLAEVRRPDLVRRVEELARAREEQPLVGIWLAVPPARAGDAAALERLRAEQRHPNVTRRDVAVRALTAAGLVEELAHTVTSEPVTALRLLAVRGLLAVTPDSLPPRSERPDELSRTVALLELATNDSEREVRLAALGGLVARGDRAAIDRALALLERPTPDDVRDALQLLEPILESDDALRERVRGALQAELEILLEGGRPLQEAAHVINALGRLPRAAATEDLLRLAARVGAEETVQGLRAERWVLLRAGGSGPEAQRRLALELADATDPERRVDLLEALSALGGDTARELLIDFLDAPHARPHELLYAADRLARIGPASEVAWRLKRAALRIEDPVVRPAFQYLLFFWYPEPAGAPR